jgi:hypothetical protein
MKEGGWRDYKKLRTWLMIRKNQTLMKNNEPCMQPHHSTSSCPSSILLLINVQYDVWEQSQEWCYLVVFSSDLEWMSANPCEQVSVLCQLIGQCNNDNDHKTQLLSLHEHENMVIDSSQKYLQVFHKWGSLDLFSRARHRASCTMCPQWIPS